MAKSKAVSEMPRQFAAIEPIPEFLSPPPPKKGVETLNLEKQL
jgi:hypothetical protein